MERKKNRTSEAAPKKTECTLFADCAFEMLKYRQDKALLSLSALSTGSLKRESVVRNLQWILWHVIVIVVNC